MSSNDAGTTLPLDEDEDEDSEEVDEELDGSILLLDDSEEADESEELLDGSGIGPPPSSHSLISSVNVITVFPIPVTQKKFLHTVQEPSIDVKQEPSSGSTVTQT